MNAQDVPSPIDLTDPQDAREWARTAQARPGRAEVFQAIGRALVRVGRADLRILELGSGPGFLAAHLLGALPEAHVTLLDSSAPMHDLARGRLSAHRSRVAFVTRSFKHSGWSNGLGRFDAVVTNQAVHELRHKRHAVGLHLAARNLLQPRGLYLVSDHFFGEGGLSSDQLYMTVAEQRDALLKAGFSEVKQLGTSGTLVLHHAT